MADKIPLYSADAEMSLLGSLLLEPELIDEVTDLIKPSDFYLTRHKDIYEHLLLLQEQRTSIDYTTLSESLRSQNKFESAGGADYFLELEYAAPITRNVREYATIIREKSLKRKLDQIVRDSLPVIVESPDSAVKLAAGIESQISQLTQADREGNTETIQDILIDVLERIEQASDSKLDFTGLTTGFRELDLKINGLQKSDLIIIAARPSMGKTAFALNIATNTALRSGASVLIFSLEMSKAQLGQRMLLSEAFVDANRIRTGEINNDKDWEAILNASDLLANTKISIDDTPGLSISEIRSKCRRFAARQPLDLIVIDYMQLMSGSGRNENRQNEISEISRGLKQLAREMNCPVICLSQLARGPEIRTDHHPMLSDLRESGSIEQDADVVLFLYREAYYNKDETINPELAELDIAKNRNGATGRMNLRWLGHITRFTEPAPEWLKEG